MDFYDYTKLHASHQIRHHTRMDCYISLEFIAKNPFLRNKVSFQRFVDNHVVDEIVKVQKAHFARQHQFQFPQPLIFGFLQEKKEGYLLDGQHRFHALQTLFEEDPSYGSLLIPVCVHMFSTMNDMRDFFFELNKHTELPEELMHADTEDDSTIIKITSEYFYTTYPVVFVGKETKRVHLPKIRRNDFMNMVGMLLRLYKEYAQPNTSITTRDLIRMIEQENRRYATQDWDATLTAKGKKPAYRQKVIDLAKTTEFWLGFSDTHKDYYAKWVLSCFQTYTGISIEPSKRTRSIRKRKQYVPKSVKSAVWNKYIGKEIGQTECLICNEQLIQKDYFSVGHVLAEIHGGPPTVDNLRPICSMCNSSMSTTHMKDFVSIHHPESYALLFQDEMPDHPMHMNIVEI